MSDINSAKKLNTYLNDIKDKLHNDEIAPVYALSAMNGVFWLDNISDFLDQKNKEIAKEIWLSLKQSGLQLEDPALLFA